MERCKRFERGLRKKIRAPVTTSSEWMEFSKLVEAAVRVEKSLAGGTPGKGVEIKVGQSRIPNLSTDRKGKEENRKFLPRVLGKKISKLSFEKQKVEIGHSENIIRTEQPGESVTSVNRRP